MNTNLFKKFAAVMCFFIMLSMTACSRGADDTTGDNGASSAVESQDESTDMEDPTTKDYENGIAFEEEGDDAIIRTTKTAPDKFFGKWEATSGQSLYQYGNVDINVKMDGTWKGNISDEDLAGTWQEKDDGIYLTSELFSFQLNFTPDGVLVMSYQPDDDDPDFYIHTVLTKK